MLEKMFYNLKTQELRETGFLSLAIYRDLWRMFLFTLLQLWLSYVRGGLVFGKHV